MNYDRAFRRLVLFSALVAVAGFCVANRDPALAVVAVPATLGAWWLRDRRIGRYVPRLLVNLLLVVAVAYAVLTLVDNLELARVAEFIIVLIVIKAFDRDRSRDYAELLMLAVFLSIGSIMTDVRLAVGLMLLVFVPLAVASAMLLQVYSGREAAAAARRAGAPPDAPPVRRAGPAEGERAAVHFRRLVAAGTVGGLMVAAVVFVVIPRGPGEGRLLRDWGPPAPGMQTGFTPEVRLGRAGFLRESQTPVLHLEVHDAEGVMMGGEHVTYLLRGNVLDRYDRERGVWMRSRSGRPPFDSVVGGVPHTLGLRQGRRPPAASRLVQTVTILNAGGDRSYLFAVQRPVRITFDRPAQLAVDTEDGRLMVENARGELRYTIESLTVEQPRVDRRPPAVQDDPPEAIRSLTAHVLREAGVEPEYERRTWAQDREAVRVIREYLRTGYAYTLDIHAPGDGQDPIEWFLLEHRRGHCEYFASAMAAMCRSVGIDARVVTGYVAAEWNPASRRYVVRESNAHAWVEVRTGVGVYQTHDPSPPADISAIHRASPTMMGRVRRMFDAVNHAWISSVVTFDQGARDRIVGSLPGRAERMVSGAREAARNMRLEGASLVVRAVVIGLAVFVAVAAVGVVLPLLIRAAAGLARRIGRRRRGAVQEPWVRRAGFYADLLTALSRAGFPKPPWRPPLEHAAEVSAADPELGREARGLVELYYRVRFGREAVSEQELREARGKAKGLGER